MVPVISPENVAAAKPAVPVNVGLAEKTTFPVPVSFESSPAKSAEVESSDSISIVEVE